MLKKISFDFRLPYIFLLVSISSCISYKDVELKQIKSFGLLNNDMSTGKLIVTLNILNPNNYDIRIKEYDLHAFLNNSDMGKLLVAEDIVLKKNSSNDYTLTIQPDMAKILSALPTLYLMGSADAAIKGKVKVKAMFLAKSFDVNLQKKISSSDFQ